MLPEPSIKGGERVCQRHSRVHPVGCKQTCYQRRKLPKLCQHQQQAAGLPVLGDASQLLREGIQEWMLHHAALSVLKPQEGLVASLHLLVSRSETSSMEAESLASKLCSNSGTRQI